VANIVAEYTDDANVIAAAVNNVKTKSCNKTPVHTDTEDRWGDYSSMSLDGADSCTFWYTQEFYPVTAQFRWDTWLASLKFPNCH
jgi:hypothetical protein